MVDAPLAVCQRNTMRGKGYSRPSKVPIRMRWWWTAFTTTGTWFMSRSTGLKILVSSNRPPTTMCKSRGGVPGAFGSARNSAVRCGSMRPVESMSNVSALS
eukprot:1494652-Pyramimonas_sp.AAC.1